ncbi:MAG TPA: hypothetical protein VJK54_10410 [Chthoniobacterales bacterium]|nr:hypothetical protein [Chthoniobacterales bacterium]
MQQPESISSIAQLFQEARQALGRSIHDAAKEAGLKEEVILYLEEKDVLKNSMLNQWAYGNCQRLLSIQYARSLNIALSEISNLLPEPPPLNPKDSLFLKNLAHQNGSRRSWNEVMDSLFSLPRRSLSTLPSSQNSSAIFKRSKKRPYSLSVMLNSVLQFFMLVAILIALFYSWSMVRHLYRVIGVQVLPSSQEGSKLNDRTTK